MLREYLNRHKDSNPNLPGRNRVSYPLDDNDIEPKQGIEPCSSVYKTDASPLMLRRHLYKQKDLNLQALSGSSF